MIPFPIQQYNEAVKNEQAARVQAFIRLPQDICGLPVKALTLNHWMKLEAIGSPFITGGQINAMDIPQFLLIVSEKKGFHRWLYLRRMSFVSAESLANSIHDYVSEAFMDSPGSSVKSKSYFCGAAAIVDLFIHEYDWPEEKTLNESVAILFQYIKAITTRNNPKASLFNPSDGISGRWLKEVNGVLN